MSVILSNPEFRAMILLGIRMTAVVFAGSWLLAMLMGFALLALRLTPVPGAERVVAAYVAYHRNVPTLVQLMLWYFGISNLLPDSLGAWLSDHDGEAIFAVIALGLCQGAFFSEDLRSGLRGVAAGQMEAARALGHGYLGALRWVVLPQAARNAVPALVNHTVSLFKNSSLAVAIGVAELTHAVREVDSRTFLTFDAYAIGTVLYLVASLLLMALGASLARRVRLQAR